MVEIRTRSGERGPRRRRFAIQPSGYSVREYELRGLSPEDVLRYKMTMEIREAKARIRRKYRKMGVDV